MPRLKQEDREYFGYYGELNIQFRIERGNVHFYETPQPVDNATVFSTLEQAKEASLAEFRKYQEAVIAEMDKNAKKISAMTEDNIFGYNPDGGW